MAETYSILIKNIFIMRSYAFQVLQEENYKKRYNLVLYNQEVEPFETILRRYNCISASAFIKKIIRGELKIVEKDENERPQTGW